MQNLFKQATAAASQAFDDIESVEYVGASPIGETVFHVTRKNVRHKATVTLNPNGLKASVEWKTRDEGAGYRVFHLQGLINSDKN